jgi:hypothetical protein
MAWKIKGPGISKQYFNHISIDDALLVLRGFLEKLQLNYVKERYNNALEEPLTIISKKIKKPLRKVECNFEENNEVGLNIRRYRDILTKQIDIRKQSLPSCPYNIKFTKEELYSLKMAGIEVVKTFVENEQLNEIWENHNLMTNTWNRLTDLLLQKSLNDNILLPLEDLDFRVELVPQFNSIVSKAKAALIEGNPKVQSLMIVRKVEDKKIVRVPEQLCLYNLNAYPLNIPQQDLPDEITMNYQN